MRRGLHACRQEQVDDRGKKQNGRDNHRALATFQRGRAIACDLLISAEFRFALLAPET